MKTNRAIYKICKGQDEVNFIIRVSAEQLYNIQCNVEKLFLLNQYDNY